MGGGEPGGGWTLALSMLVSGPEDAKDLRNLRWGRASAGGWTLVLSASVQISGGGAYWDLHGSTQQEC